MRRLKVTLKGKIRNSAGIEVVAIPIGEPRMLERTAHEEFTKHGIKQSAPRNTNAYVLSKEEIPLRKEAVVRVSEAEGGGRKYIPLCGQIVQYYRIKND